MVNLQAVYAAKPSDNHNDFFTVALPGIAFPATDNFKMRTAAYWADAFFLALHIADSGVILIINQFVFYDNYHGLLFPTALFVFFAAAARAGVIATNFSYCYWCVLTRGFSFLS